VRGSLNPLSSRSTNGVQGSMQAEKGLNRRYSPAQSPPIGQAIINRTSSQINAEHNPAHPAISGLNKTREIHN